MKLKLKLLEAWAVIPKGSLLVSEVLQTNICRGGEWIITVLADAISMS